MDTITLEKGSKKAQHKLGNLDVKEVSIVDRPANQRKFLITKRDDQGNLIMEVSVMKTDESSFMDILDLGEAQTASEGSEPAVEDAEVSADAAVSEPVSEPDGQADELIDLPDNEEAEETAVQKLAPVVEDATSEPATEDLVLDTEVVKIFIDPADKSDDPMVIIEEVTKAGAKMKKARLNQFEKAVNTLMGLLEELRGNSVNKKEQPVADDTSDALLEKLDAGLKKGLEALEERLEGSIKKSVEGISEQLDAVQKKVNAFDSASPEGNGAAVEDVHKNASQQGNFWGSLQLIK